MEGNRKFFARKHPTCQRGLLCAEAWAEDWVSAERADDEEWDWVESARFSGAVTGMAPALLSAPRVRSMARLHFHDTFGDDPAAPTRLAGLRFLRMSIHGANAQRFADDFRPGLQELELWVGGGGARNPELFSSAGVAALRGLALIGGSVYDDQAITLSRMAFRRLEISAHRLSEAGLAALGNLPLRRLRLVNAGLGAAAIPILARTGCGATLEELRIWGWMQEPPSAVRARMPRLRRLALPHCNLGPDAIGSLDIAPLDELDLSDNALGTRGIAALGDPGPSILKLASCGLDDEAAARLAAWPGLARVRYLDLIGNSIGKSGAAALCASQHLGALEALGISRNHTLGASGVEILLAGWGGGLRWLAAEGCAPPDEMVEALIRQRPPGLRDLRLGDHAIMLLRGATMARLRAALPGCAIG
ncbi:MAG: hypothetical protein K2W96_06385 [Gemmataceae bacterium]|nr:hypothetical protein [Gemmataceae bacterium]